MHERLTEIIARETYGKSYRAKRYSLDDRGRTYETQEENVRVWKKSAESSHKSKYINIYPLSQKLSHSGKQIFTYFIDGTRRVFKVDEIVYGKKFYPILAGQICVGCCVRRERRLFPDKLKHEIVIALPDIADSDGMPGFFPAIAHKINDSTIMKSSGLEISSVLTYKTSNDKNDKLEDKAEACIQTRMLEREKELTEQTARKLNYKNYLIKDGSLEYRRQSGLGLQNYRYVIGISKSFNPGLCRNNHGREDPEYIADLPLYHRTQAACFENEILGDAKFAVWYIRIHDKANTHSVFDGIIKAEKMLVTQTEREQGIMSSDEIDMLSAYILNERNPVCSVKDSRWASHIYPVYLTESYIKSKCISSEIFMHLF